MKAILEHVGIAVADLDASLAFFRDDLGLEVSVPDKVASQNARAQFVTLRVDDIHAALRQVRERGARLIDDEPRRGAEGALVAFIHPSSAHGVLVELKQAAAAPRGIVPPVTIPLGEIEISLLSDGFFHLDGGAMFGVIPKPMWQKKAPPDERNRIRMAMRPALVRGARTLLIDAGCGDKMSSPKLADIYGFEREFNLRHSLAMAGTPPEAIDIVLASHLHFDHAGGFTERMADGSVRPRFPRAQYVARRGEWEDAMHPTERTRATYLAENLQPLADAHVLQLVDEDATIMPGVRVRRTGGHTMHHQIVMIESGGKTAVFAADLLPTAAHLPEVWIMGYDLFPLDTLDFKRAFLREAIEREYLILFEHDPDIAAGYIRERDGKKYIEKVA